MQMTDVVNRRQMRHAHMVNIDRRIMVEGYARRFDEVDRISTQGMAPMASAGARDSRHQSGRNQYRGAVFTASEMAQNQRHHQPHKWGNLPGGETFTTPERVDGTFVIDGVVGDYLCEKYGDLAPRRSPFKWKTAAPARSPSAPTTRWKRILEVLPYRRIQRPRGRVAIGTNIGVHE